MLRNYVTTALRNLMRHRLYAAINVLGLAVGIAAALLIAIYILDEYSYDTWIPGHEKTYILTMTNFDTQDSAEARRPSLSADNMFAADLKLDYPVIEMTARAWSNWRTLRRGDIEDRQHLVWADPDLFRLLPLPVVAGDLATAIDQPDSIVLTRKLARKYFGRDNVIGETIELDRSHAMRVTAIIEDLPSNTTLRFECVASGRSSFSPMMAFDVGKRDSNRAGINVDGETYLRLAPGTSAEDLAQDFPEFINRHKTVAPWQTLNIGLLPLAEAHLTLTRYSNGDMAPRTAMAMFAIVGALIVGLAVINFVNLMTARAARRAVEIGVRKVSGAERCDLIVQFVGEAALYIVLAVVAAMCLACLLMPVLNTALDRLIPSPLGQSRLFFACLLVGAALTAVLAGFYPALVLSAFRPATVLKSGSIRPSGNPQLRQSLVTLQFAILIGLSLIGDITYRQTMFAQREAMRADTDQILMISSRAMRAGQKPAACRPAFRNAVTALVGVAGAQCSSSNTVSLEENHSGNVESNGRTISIGISAVDDGFFAFFGLSPVAGRVFAPDYGDLEAALNPEATQLPVVLNETAARAYGFASPEEAIGQIVNVPGGGFTGTKASRGEIIGIVDDFKNSVYRAPRPTVYFAASAALNTLNVRLKGRQIPETLEAIDRLWAQMGDPGSTPRQFFDAYLQNLYRTITQRAQVFVAFAGVAAFIALLGMFGLASFIAERRTKEIGIRKSMGATRKDILRLLVWEFCKPVLLANLIAWPAAVFFMHRWLQGFVYHIDLSPWMFLAASALALVIAVLTVIGHALLVARAKPVTALRYE